MKEKLEFAGLLEFIAFFEIFLISYLVFIRPYYRPQDNLIEILNQVFFFMLVILLFFLNKSAQWSIQWESIFMFVVTGNNIAVVLVLFGKFEIGIVL